MAFTGPRPEFPKPPPAAASFKQTLDGLVRDWAQTLVPSNAPDQRHRGPLAWVRMEKVPELLEILNKAGYK